MLHALLLLACSPPEPAPRAPDVLVVVEDTVRADRSGLSGSTRNTGPQLRALAETGVVFEDVTAPASWTWPSHASLFTGEPPWVHGAHWAGDPGTGLFVDKARLPASPMREDLPTLAERFAAAGYRTVCLSANPFLGPSLGITRGFEDTRYLAGDAEVAEAAREAIGAQHDLPLLLFLNFTGAHGPYVETPADWLPKPNPQLDPAAAPEWVRPYLVQDPAGINLYAHATADSPSGYDQYHSGALAIPDDGMQLLVDLYDGELVLVDVRLYQVLKAWYERTKTGVIAVASDHGEMFGEHDRLDHGFGVYRQEVQVPLVISAPGRLPAGVRVSTPVQLQALHSTLLELAGLGEGGDTLVAVAAGAVPDDPILAASWPASDRAHLGGRFLSGWRHVRRGDMVLVARADDPSDNELFDLSTDPEMLHDIAAERPDVAAELAALASTAFPEAEAPQRHVVEMSSQTADALRALGYVE